MHEDGEISRNIREESRNVERHSQLVFLSVDQYWPILDKSFFFSSSPINNKINISTIFLNILILESNCYFLLLKVNNKKYPNDTFSACMFGYPYCIPLLKVEDNSNFSIKFSNSYIKRMNLSYILKNYFKFSKIWCGKIFINNFKSHYLYNLKNFYIL